MVQKSSWNTAQIPLDEGGYQRHKPGAASLHKTDQEKKMREREKQDLFGLFESMVRFVLPHLRILFLPFFICEVGCVFCRWIGNDIHTAESSW